MPPVDTVGDYCTLYLHGAGGDRGVWGSDIKHLGDIIITQFLSQYYCARSLLGSIRTGLRCCVKPRLVSGEGVTLKHCRVEMYEIWKWDPPPTEEAFLIPGRGDIIIINSFLLRSELSSDIVAILECTKRTESEMQTFFQITDPPNKEENLDPHEPKVLFFGTPEKQESSGQASLRNL